jgi:hypothetical protein
VQQPDRDRIRLRRAHAADDARDLAGRERREDAAPRREPLAGTDPSLAGHQGRPARGLQRIDIGPLLAADLEHVLEARGGDQRDPRALPLEQRIGRHRGAMTHARAAAGPGARESLEHGLRRVAGRGRDLERHALAASPGDDVGERAAGVDADRACSAICHFMAAPSPPAR